MNALAPVRPKLALLIPMLGSDHDGEVIAAARAISRTLQSARLDLHDLAREFAEKPHREQQRPQPAKEYATGNTREIWAKLGSWDRREWLRLIAAASWASPWERSFAESLERQLDGNPWRRLTPKQQTVVDRLFARAWLDGTD